MFVEDWMSYYCDYLVRICDSINEDADWNVNQLEDHEFTLSKLRSVDKRLRLHDGVFYTNDQDYLNDLLNRLDSLHWDDYFFASDA